LTQNDFFSSYKRDIMQLFNADPTILLNIFCPQKVEKTTLKSCSEKPKSTFFSLLP
jgi:hypothetical protein